METGHNLYCEHLGVPVPRVEEVVGRGVTKLFHIMVVALLERGAPMTLEEIAARLDSAGVWSETGDLCMSITKAWHGLEPVYRDREGRFGLNLRAPQMCSLLFATGLRSPATPPPPALEPELPGDDVPLSAEELDAAFRDRDVWNVSSVRQVAAVLDVHRAPMTLAQIEAVLARLTPHRRPIEVDRPLPKSPLLLRREGGRFELDLEDASVAGMRRAVRAHARTEMIRREGAARLELHMAELAARRAEALRRDAAAASALRRAVVRAVPSPEGPQALAVLDVARRSIRAFVGGEIAAAPLHLSRFDLVAGLHVRDTLGALGLEADRFRLVDLKPPKKSMRINRQGRTLSITPELLISGTIGTSRPLGDPAAVARYLAEGSVAKLIRRIESDVKALFAFYQYGTLHNYVRLRWGFIDESLGVEWALPGDPQLHGILTAAIAAASPVAIVLGASPGWTDPWSRAQRVRVVSVGSYDVILETEHAERITVTKAAIQAIRPMDSVRPDGTSPQAAVG